MRLPLVLALVLAATPGFAGPASDAVRFFYASPGAELEPANRDRFTGEAKAVLDANDKAELCIDFMLGIDAQDFDQAELDRTLRLDETLSGDAATVDAHFTLFPGDPAAEQSVVWTLRQVDGAWKVADIESQAGEWRLGGFDCEGQ